MTDKGTTRRAARLMALTEQREEERVQAEIERRYGFQPTLDYCRDLIAFVDAMAGTETGTEDGN